MGRGRCRGQFSRGQSNRGQSYRSRGRGRGRGRFGRDYYSCRGYNKNGSIESQVES